MDLRPALAAALAAAFNRLARNPSRPRFREEGGAWWCGTPRFVFLRLQEGGVGRGRGQRQSQNKQRGWRQSIAGVPRHHVAGLLTFYNSVRTTTLATPAATRAFCTSSTAL